MNKWDKLCQKYKFIDWIDDNIVWYIYDKPKHFYRGVKQWFHSNWNKEFWNLVKCVFTSHPWDNYYFDAIQLAHINRMIGWFDKHQIVENHETDIDRPLRWVRHCLNVQMNDNYLLKYIPEAKDIMDRFVYIGPKLNYKNARRFINRTQFHDPVNFDEVIEFYKKNPEEYYKLKAKYLYHKILLHYEDRWWD